MTAKGVTPEVNGEEAYAARDKVRAVMEAAQSGDVDMLKGAALQFEGSDLSEVCDGNGRCALHFAAQAGHLAVCEAAVKEHNVQVNKQDGDGLTPLALACVGGNLDVIKKLVELGAVVTASEKSEIQPLHHAAAAGNTEIVKFLLDQGADLHATTSAGPPLLWAAGAGKWECLAFLLDLGADANTKNPDGVTALIMATASGCHKSVSTLIERGADASVKAVGGVTALHVAFGSNSEDAAVEFVQMLLDAGGDPNIPDDEGNLPIHAAAMEGCRKGVEFLFPRTTLSEGSSGGEWSIDGLLKAYHHPHIHDHPSPVGPEVKIEIPEPETPDKEMYDKVERQGNEAFVKSDMDSALELYTKALTYWTQDAKVWANRAAVHLRMGKPELALDDSRRSRALDPKFIKAWYREGCSLRDMQRWEESALTFYEGLQLEPENKALAREFQKVIMEGRKEHQRLHEEGKCGHHHHHDHGHDHDHAQCQGHGHDHHHHHHHH